MKIVLFSFAALFTFIIGGMLINVIFFPLNTASKLIDTAYDAQNKVLNADNAIYNYEWFKQKYQDIEASKKQLLNSKEAHASFRASAGDRKDWTFEDKTEDARLLSVVLGQENYLESQIGDYNARASMATRNIFQDGVLPSFIDALTFIKK
jgi:hypothetical protein